MRLRSERIIIPGGTISGEVQIAAVARFHAVHGTTALLATTVSAPDGRKGEIASGLDGDLVVLDDDLRCVATIVRGRWVHGSPETL